MTNALGHIEDLRGDPRVYLNPTVQGQLNMLATQLIAGALRSPELRVGQPRSPTAGSPVHHGGRMLFSSSANASIVTCVEFQRQSVLVDGLTTGYLEAGAGDPVVLLHGGEFGASAELGWERTVDALARRYRVLAPDMLGYGDSAKVIDFVDGRGLRIRHVARFCDVMGVTAAHFVGNSMGAINLLTDATSGAPVLPVRSLTLICGGGEIQRNEHADALYEYDGSVEGMRRIVTALFVDPAYPADEEYVRRRHESSTAPGAWEAIAAARFRRPGLTPPSTPSTTRAYERITVPTLVIEGAGDKLLPPGWAADIAGRIAHGRSAVVDGAGHCPQLERPDAVNELLLGFLEGSSTQ